MHLLFVVREKLGRSNPFRYSFDAFRFQLDSLQVAGLALRTETEVEQLYEEGQQEQITPCERKVPIRERQWFFID